VHWSSGQQAGGNICCICKQPLTGAACAFDPSSPNISDILDMKGIKQTPVE